MKIWFTNSLQFVFSIKMKIRKITIGNIAKKKSSIGSGTRKQGLFFARANSEIDTFFKRIRRECGELFAGSEDGKRAAFGKYLYESVGEPERGIIETFRELVLGGNIQAEISVSSMSIYDYLFLLNETIARKRKELKDITHDGRTSNIRNSPASSRGRSD